MDAQNYKSVETRRGYTYSYYISIGKAGKPCILFLHGFPSTSKDWKAQVQFFAAKGFTIVAPDLLGYGGTSKPADPGEYNGEGMANDIADILDNEGIRKAVVVSHDWGSYVNSRFINYHPERLIGVAFLAVGYNPPATDFDYYQLMEIMNKFFGNDLFGYWEYFASGSAAEICQNNIDSFYSLVFPKDPTLWKTEVGPRGKFKEWIEGNKQGPLPSYWDDEAKREHQKNFIQNGFAAPMNWYATVVKRLNGDKESTLPKERHTIPVPAMFIAALQDYICLPALGIQRMQPFSKDLVVEEIDTSHWIMFEKPDELNAMLEKFVAKLA